jgi:hypothetical protein
MSMGRQLSQSFFWSLIFATFLAPQLALAESVKADFASSAAQTFASRNYAPASVAKQAGRLAAPGVPKAAACRPLESGGEVVGYVVDLFPSGFIVMRSDDALPAVKLHAPAGAYEALPIWFRQVVEAELAGERAELAAARKAAQPAEPSYQAEWKALSQTAALSSADLALGADSWSAASAAGIVLLSTTWEQSAFYNYYAPAASGGDGGRASAGCGPIAMAQIMKFHQKPARPVSDYAYADLEGSCVGTHALHDVGLGDYDWAGMPSALTSSSPLTQIQAVSRLVYHCGVAMEADFEASATSVISFFAAARMLRQVFGYTCEDYQSRSAYATTAWLAKIQADIDARHPIYYTMVSSAAGGHAVVCDGYRNSSEIHLNFGIGGYGDAWYNVNSVVFYNTTWTQHAAVFGITPDASQTSNLLTVVSGSGGGQYLAGEEVVVAADAPAAGGQFRRWTVSPSGIDLGGGFVQTQSVTTITMPSQPVTLTASYKTPNVLPALSRLSPTNGTVALREGASSSFSLSASDSADPDTEDRGMVSVTWSVDGVVLKTVATGAPGAITAAYSYVTGTNTVVGAASRDVAVRAVATDRQGGSSETGWVVRVQNVPARQTIAFPALPTLALGASGFSPGARASSGLPVAYASSNESVAKIVDGLICVVGAGSAFITASQPGDFDFSAATPVRQTLTVKARVDALVSGGAGAVSGAGFYAPGAKAALTARPASGYTFLRWEDGSQVAARALTVPASNVTAQAWFGVTTNVPPPALAAIGAQQGTVGVFWRLPLDVQSESLPSVAVSGLPAGLRYNAAARAIEGVPAAAVTNRTVTVQAKNVNRAASVQTFTLNVEPLPAWAQGSFSGTSAYGPSEHVAEMAVTAQGKISGKLAYRGTNYAFSAACFTNGAGYAFAAEAVAGKVKVPLALAISQPALGAYAPPLLSVAEGQTSGPWFGGAGILLYRHVWKDPGMVTVLTNYYTGYYTAVLPAGEDVGCGYLTITVDKAGAVKAAGKLADGTALSLSGTLLCKENGGVSAVFYAAPAAYQGGLFFTRASFNPNDDGFMSLDDESYAIPNCARWESLNPRATGVFEAGFSHEMVIIGGWYDTLGNLCRYYTNGAITVHSYGGAAPALTVGTNRYDSVWWSPEGLVVTPVTNRLGAFTGFAPPPAGTPARLVDGSYDYAGTANAVGLTLALNRATGVFRGSLKAWFDYGATHASRSIAYEGALVPECVRRGWVIEGAGFFLWPQRATYVDAAGKQASYTYNDSYTFELDRE